MNTNIKNALGVLGGLFILALIVVSIFYAHAFKKSVADTAPSFTVSGEGKVVATPDIAEFSFSVITEGEDTAKLQSSNTEKVNKAIEFLKQNGVEAKDIKTSNYNVYPRYNYFPCLGDGRTCEPPEISGYTVEQSVSVKARNLEIVGKLLSGVVENGANSVSGLFFTVEDMDVLKAQARKEAFDEAKSKALQLASAGGFKLGKLLSVQEGDSGYPMPYPMYDKTVVGRDGSTEEAMLPVNVEPGSQDVSITVTLQYEIK